MNHSQQSGMDAAAYQLKPAGLGTRIGYRNPKSPVEASRKMLYQPFATAYRGFGHIELAFVIERAMDLLAEKLGMDPIALRMTNAIQAGDTTPTQNILDDNTGDLKGCLAKVAERVDWDKGIIEKVDETRGRAKGAACFWKAPAIPTNTEAGASITFNNDGTMNLATGAVEIGQGSQTGLAQITAEAFGVSAENVHVVREVVTDKAPHDWTTAASRTLFMAGNAALMACEDAKQQIRDIAAQVFRCQASELKVHGGSVFIEKRPGKRIPLGRIVNGYTYDDGTSIGGPVIGSGRYITPDLTHVDPETGKGHPGLEWTIGAQAVEVEVDLSDGSFSIVRAACAMDVGKVIHPKLAHGQVEGAMAMGIGFTTIEGIENQALKEAFVVHNGFQCGYCTSGMIVNIDALFKNDANPEEATIRSHLQSNLCRCTGYEGIEAAIKSLKINQHNEKPM
ncbi:MAG: molybdopterin-dependent oxidoreductase [Desulfobacteraceae bacterium]